MLASDKSVSHEPATRESFARAALSLTRLHNVKLLVGTLHAIDLENTKLFLDIERIHDINNVQALMLLGMNKAAMTVGDLTLRGHYLGSNVSYNVKKMVKNGYLNYARSPHDRRSIIIEPTEKGGALTDKLNAFTEQQGKALGQAGNITDDALATTVVTLERLERFLHRVPGLLSAPRWYSPRRLRS